MTNNNLEWKEKFREKFLGIGDGWYSHGEIESFISSLLTQQRQSVLEEAAKAADRFGENYRRSYGDVTGEEIAEAIRGLK